MAWGRGKARAGTQASFGAWTTILGEAGGEACSWHVVDSPSDPQGCLPLVAWPPPPATA
eukprot:CAMPEP_0115531584 /NCGR_PEP_ID=MMETSP0271-20121206/85125_1 /TAXON_ID=71861 /ORGANISM="Scrippsiella trochoidea, Strain CCMP3099" /LENGTH=58 /DNA_ID=CAMNT_0002963827 /DNA_START=25 /DNA_END=197 /DNA_ORIENTATION=-